MSAISCQLYQVLIWLVNVYTIILLVYAVVSWIPDIRGRWTSYLGALVEPVLSPLRRIIPAAGGIDWSFLVLILIIQIVIRPLLANLANNACALIY